MKLEIVTADGTVYSEPVEMVTVQGLQGRITFSPHDAPEIAQVTPGEMIVQREGRTNSLTLGEGFVLVSNGLIAVITEMVVAE